jgi:hypothetical protein
MLPIPDFGRWWAALLFGLMLLFLLLIAAWLLRSFVPVAPTINLGAVQMPPPVAPVGVPDPMLTLKASLDVRARPGSYAQFVEREVLPLVEQQTGARS